MKAVILCGGRGTRLGEHGRTIPKALIKIGGKPIIWHLLDIFSRQGVKSFVLCLGYLGEEIREWFSQHQHHWQIEFIDTGLDTNTGGRLNKIKDHLSDEKHFFVTYGDGLADIDLAGLIERHASCGQIATITTVHPHSNFGIVELDDDGGVIRFHEKPLLKDWINGGFFVFTQQIFDYLDDECTLEREPFEQLADAKQMNAYRHEGFWKCMDTFKDNLEFEQLWKDGAPWLKEN